MEKVQAYDLGDNFIEKFSTFLKESFLKEGNDLSRVACVFGGQRPALFLKQALSKNLIYFFLIFRSQSIHLLITLSVNRQQRQ